MMPIKQQLYRKISQSQKAIKKSLIFDSRIVINSVLYLILVMMHFKKIVFTLSNISPSLKPLQGIVSAHILNILDQDCVQSQRKYSLCRQYMTRVAGNCSADSAKLKCNLIFSANSTSESLQHTRPILCDLIVRQEIKSQYQLDQLVKWLTKEVKVNRNIGQRQIKEKLSERGREEDQFQLQLQKLQQKREESVSNLNDVCKTFRQKYLMIDSKTIYERVSRMFKLCGEKSVPKKDNKLWDKLLEIRPRQLKSECNSKEVYDEHLKVTGGRPRFRFPPQPNGYLHIGHIKSIRVNFESAVRMGGTCFLRYDDTNPDKETHEFIREIEDNVRWLGYTPDRVTFASDYFEQLEYYAYQLIKNGHAYVCDTAREEIQLERKEKRANPYRERKIQESLKIFPNLAFNQTLRLKGIPDSANPTLRDPILYRLKEKPHPRTGNRFKIYPMYDFTHCISDSLEHIDYSLCSLQFEVRRELYYMFLDLLGLYKPVVWEYSRLNIEGNVLSKRKIKEFVESGVVDGWDDPRLLTIKGLRNRGYTPQMLKQFIDKVNCSRSGNENIIQYSLLQKEMKKSLLATAAKTMGVVEPFSVIISNFHEKVALREQEDQLKPSLQQNLFVQVEDAANLKKNDIVVLKYAGAFQVVDKKQKQIVLSLLPDQNINALRKNNPQIRVIHWINQSESVPFSITMYDRLLDNEGKPNPKSKVTHTQSRILRRILDSKPSYIQLERVGFFKFSQVNQELTLCTRI